MEAQGVAYVRISDDREGRELGVQRQEADCRERAARDGVEIIRVYVDNDLGASRHSRKVRPDYRQMLADAEQGTAGRFIYAYSNSRLTRRPREFEDLLELHDMTGIQIRTIVSGDDNLGTADGRMVARMKAVVDAAEAERLSERITRKLQQNAADGKHHGGMRPFGWNEDRVTLRGYEADIIRECADRVLAGDSIRSIVRGLTERGVPTASWHPPLVLKPWRDVTLRDILGKARIGGLREYKGDVVGPGQWEPIITPERWYELHAFLSNPSRRKTPGRNGERHMLSGVALCGICGGLLRVGKGKAYKGVAKRCYRCRSGCVIRDKDALEGYITEVIVARLSGPDAAVLLADPAADTQPATRQRIDELRERLADAASAFAAGKISVTQLIAINEAVEPQLREAEESVSAPARVEVLAGLVGARDIRAVWEALSAVRQRAVVDLLMSVTVNKTRRGPGFDPASVVIKWRTVTA